MTRDDIIRMAREAGLLQIIPDTVHWHGVDCIEAFAALVAAAERKTCEVACAQALEYARLAEREDVINMPRQVGINRIDPAMPVVCSFGLFEAFAELVAKHQTTWIPTADSLPPIETPVIAFYRGECRILERRTEDPGWEATYAAFDYWDDPTDDGQEIDDSDVTHWMPTPPDPVVDSEIPPQLET